MTLTLSVTDTTIDLAQLLKHARQGENVIIIEDGKPVARFVLLDKDIGARRVPGSAKGQIWIADDFNAPLSEEMQEAFES
jgi:antitoxin (DNA-binding transcriptional repressor) of toxin-antitoxin stability system